MADSVQPAVDFLARALSILLLALLPANAPLALREPAQPLAAAAFVAFVVVSAIAARVLARRAPVPAALVIATALAAAIGAALYEGDRGPLARAVFWMTPLVWATVGALVAWPLLDALGLTGGERSKNKKARAAAFVVVLAIAPALLYAARARIASRTTIWQAVLAADAGNEPAALFVATAKTRDGDRLGGHAVLLACARARPTACRCADREIEEALDLGRYDDAIATLDASPACEPAPREKGMRAEALSGQSRGADALALATDALKHDPKERHALLASARSLYLAGALGPAKTYAQDAVAEGRGAIANLLLGLVLFAENDLAGAAAQFSEVLAKDPLNVAATFDLALVAHKNNRNREAREGYLRTLTLDPKNADARYNLAILTHENGFDDESSHHLDELSRIAPADPRIAPLRRALKPKAP